MCFFHFILSSWLGFVVFLFSKTLSKMVIVYWCLRLMEILYSRRPIFMLKFKHCLDLFSLLLLEEENMRDTCVFPIKPYPPNSCMKTYLPWVVFPPTELSLLEWKVEKFSQGTPGLSCSVLCLSICFLLSIWGNGCYFPLCFFLPALTS